MVLPIIEVVASAMKDFIHLVHLSSLYFHVVFIDANVVFVLSIFIAPQYTIEQVYHVVCLSLFYLFMGVSEGL